MGEACTAVAHNAQPNAQLAAQARHAPAFGTDSNGLQFPLATTPILTPLFELIVGISAYAHRRGC
ncbi:hypothetical protein D3C87_2172770 [compost metagenome]